jgi:hypothetical protein
MGAALTPVLQKSGGGGSITMDFFDALKAIDAGKMVARVSWENKDYCLMKNGWLTIFTKGKFHSWLINDGDMEGSDWIIVTGTN